MCLFYLILRGLDTVEDDMSIDRGVKIALLNDFHNVIYQDGWSFDGNSPTEKDRGLLVRGLVSMSLPNLTYLPLPAGRLCCRHPGV